MTTFSFPIRSGLLALAMLAPLAGCTSVTPDPFLTSSVRPDAPTIASEVAPEFAVALLPVTAGRIKSVRQVASPNGLTQDIVYDSPTGSFGENAITVSVGRTDLDRSFFRAPSKRTVMQEMRKLLPGVAMTIQPAINENNQGVFGYATGKFGENGSCLYGWQLVNPDHGRSTVALMVGINQRFRTQIRVRYCDANLPQERISTLMEGLRVKPVSADTVAMLQFATGSGASSAIPAVTPEPAAKTAPVLRHRARAPRTADDNANLEDVTLPIIRRSAPAAGVALPVASSGAPVVIQAAAVPLPGAPADGSPIDPTVTAAPTKVEKPLAALVPLPN